MTMELKYDPSMAGAKLAAVNDNVQFHSEPGKGYGTAVDATAGDYIICTGYYYLVSGYAYVQSTAGWYAVVDFGDMTGWQLTANYAQLPRATATQAQVLVQRIIDNNKAIIRNNLLCARYANRFTAQEQQLIRALQQRLQARNEMLQAGGLCKDIETSYPAEYVELSPYLEKLMAGEAVGIATWVVVVIAATVVTATATAAYFTYKSLADESEKDVQFSKELTATLVNKLTEEEYQQLLDETKGMLTKAKIKALVSGGIGSLKWVALAAGAYVIYKVVKQNL